MGSQDLAWLTYTWSQWLRLQCRSSQKQSSCSQPHSLLHEQLGIVVFNCEESLRLCSQKPQATGLSVERIRVQQERPMYRAIAKTALYRGRVMPDEERSTPESRSRVLTLSAQSRV